MSEEDKDKDKEASPTTKPVLPAKPKRARPVKKGATYEDLTDDALLERMKEKFGEGILSGQSFLGQRNYTVALNCVYDVMIHLRDDPECDFDYLIDVTALDYLGDEQRFVMVYHLFSYSKGAFVRFKTRAGEGEIVPSMTSIWRTANWLEREVYDMFGIEFSGHPDLKRILLPDDWHGHPLRKDYDIKLQDQAWIRQHLRVRKTPA